MVFDMILARLISILIGYLFGLFETGYFYGKMYGIDIRKQGSGNSGATNTLRTLGKKAGIITCLGDILKTVLAVIVARAIFKDRYPDGVMLLGLYAGFGAVLGHNFPFYLKFKGGKGVACTGGTVLAVFPIVAPVSMGLFLILPWLHRWSCNGVSPGIYLWKMWNFISAGFLCDRVLYSDVLLYSTWNLAAQK